MKIGTMFAEVYILKKKQANFSFIQDGGVTRQSSRFVFTVRYFVCI